MGASSRSMIEAIIHNISYSQLMPKLAKGRLKSKRKNLEQALHGLVGPHQRRMFAAQLQHIDFLDKEIKSLDEEVGVRLHPFEEELELLDTVSGVGRHSVECILVEIDADMEDLP